MKVTAIPYRLAFYCWLRLPEPVRSGISKTPALEKLRILTRNVLAAGGSRDDIYSGTYYRRVDSLAAQSAAPITQMIVDEFAPESVVDLGCGTGAMLVDLQTRGVKVLGLEYSRSALKICQRRGLDVREHNIEAGSDITGLGRFDVAICAEVAEHVKPQFAENLVRELTTLSDQIVFTAAVPGQGGGVDHVNEQPNSYWIRKFARHGFVYLEERTTKRREQLSRAGAVGFYADNLMLFQREGSGSRLDRSYESGA
jgi:SAM-dependent methyltransferase